MYPYQENKVRPSLVIFSEENDALYERGGRTPSVNSFSLITGSRCAVLIDTGDGRGRLDELVRKYTDLPVIALITHGDGDHNGAVRQFPERYMSKLDDEILAGQAFSHNDLADGQIFDLGGIRLEAVAVPGHTKGSFCFLDREHNDLFSGDSVNKLPWLFLERCTSLSTYRESLERLRGMTGDQTSIYCGHSLTAFPYQVLLDSITACDEVLCGKTENDLPYRMPFSPDSPILPDVSEHQVGPVRLIYNKKKLY